MYLYFGSLRDTAEGWEVERKIREEEDLEKNLHWEYNRRLAELQRKASTEHASALSALESTRQALELEA